MAEQEIQQQREDTKTDHFSRNYFFTGDGCVTFEHNIVTVVVGTIHCVRRLHGEEFKRTLRRDHQMAVDEGAILFLQQNVTLIMISGEIGNMYCEDHAQCLIHG
jgi:hypothetical protein